MLCPKCRLFNPPDALRCDCGYDFETGEMKRSYIAERSTPKRPISLTLISWILMIAGVVGMLRVTVIVNTSALDGFVSVYWLPTPLIIALLYLDPGLTYLSGLGMLKGHSWARTMYVVGSALSLPIGFGILQDPRELIPKAIVFPIIMCILYRKRASQYLS